MTYHKVQKPIWKISYKLSIHLKNIKTIKPVTLFLAFPDSLVLRQNIKELRCSSPVKEITDELGNSWLSIEVGNEHREFSFAYQALVEPARLQYKWDAFSTDWPDPPERFLRSEAGIEADSDEIVELAEKIRAKSKRLIVYKAFELVHELLEYELQKNEYGAKYAARKKRRLYRVCESFLCTFTIS